MNENLEVIANLEYGKLVARISNERLEKMRRAASIPPGGQREQAFLEVLLDQVSQTCNGYAQIWTELLERGNDGQLTRASVDFIKGKVAMVVQASKSNLLKLPELPRLASTTVQIENCAQHLTGSINTDLEIRLRKQQAFPPKKEPMSYKQNVNVTIHSAGNVNLGTQVGTITAALTEIAQQGSHEKIVAALKELTDAVRNNAEIDDTQKRETLEVVEVIAKQAVLKPESRSLGTVKTMISGLNTLIGASHALMTAWDKCGPLIRQHFNL
jgi:hypothetical protein